MATIQREWTVGEVRALPDDGQRYEVVDGALLVSPSPRLLHQEAVGELLARIKAYLAGARAGYAFAAPADITFGPRTLVQPDLFVAPPIGGRRPREWVDITTLLLTVEVLSPATARADRTVKRTLYQRMAVPEYWIVDLQARRVERWRPQAKRTEIVDGTLSWQPSAELRPLEIHLPSFFAGVWDDG